MPRDASALEIHAINVSQGDSFLIINRDLAALRTKIIESGLHLPAESLDWLPYAIFRDIDLEGTVRKALLIDGGEDYYGSDVLTYIQKYGVKGDATRLNFMTLVSHFHSDHVDGMRFVYKRRVPIPLVGKLQWQTINNYPPAHVYDMGSDPILNPFTATYCLYMDDVTGFQTDALTTRHLIHPVARTVDGIHSENVIDMGVDANNVAIRLVCIASNGVVSQAGNAPIDIMAGRRIRAGKADQNDRSTVMVLEYGDFRCIFGGDAGGNGRAEGGNFDDNCDNRTPQFYSSHGDLETPLRSSLTLNYPADGTRLNTAAGHICCFKAHHHGSGSSNDAYFIKTMQPKVVLCSSGTLTKFHGHPTQEAINRTDPTVTNPWPAGPTVEPAVANTVDTYYITEMAVDGDYKWGGSSDPMPYNRIITRGQIMGDIITRPFNVISPTLPNWAGAINIQVYGSGLQSAVEPGDKQLLPTNPNNANPYPIGPWEHTCDKH